MRRGEGALNQEPTACDTETRVRAAQGLNGETPGTSSSAPVERRCKSWIEDFYGAQEAKNLNWQAPAVL